jgi:hypothetical protein
MKQGRNRTIYAYRIKRNKPVWIGKTEINTAAYRGDKATAHRIIADAEGYNMTDGCRIDRKDVQVWAL